jgi:hypothetical protein
VRQAKVVGRTALERQGEVSLSVINPERYRPEVIAVLAASVRDLRSVLVSNCKIDLGDLSQRLQWQRTEVSELTLYIPYSLTVREC